MSRKTLAGPNHEYRDDELLSNVNGGTSTRGTGGGRDRGNHSGGDGLGWLRNFLRALL